MDVWCNLQTERSHVLLLYGVEKKQQEEMVGKTVTLWRNRPYSASLVPTTMPVKGTG